MRVVQDRVDLACKKLVRAFANVGREVAVVDVRAELRAHIVKLTERRVDRLLDELARLRILGTCEIAQLADHIRVFRLEVGRQLLEKLLGGVRQAVDVRQVPARCLIGSIVHRRCALADRPAHRNQFLTDRAPEIARIVPGLGHLHPDLDVVLDILVAGVDHFLRGGARFLGRFQDCLALGDLPGHAGFRSRFLGIQRRLHLGVFLGQFAKRPAHHRLARFLGRNVGDRLGQAARILDAQRLQHFTG